MIKQKKSHTIPRRKTLFWKLVSVFFWVSCAGTALHFVAFVNIHRFFLDRVKQGAAWETAAGYARTLQPLTSPEYKTASVENALMELRFINPTVDVYLLKADGEVLYRNSSRGLSRVPLEPIKRFLNAQWFPLSPIYGPNPSWLSAEEKKSPISVAPIKIAGQEGYVYVILDGCRYQMAFHTFGDFVAVASSILFFVLLVLFTTLLGALLIQFASKRFRLLTAVMQRFSAGELKIRVEELSNDEVGLHGRTFNEMADTIEANIHSLEEKDLLRRQLVANVSHDLRTPVGAMQALLETMRNDFERMPQAQQKEFLDRSLANCRDLNTLVGDLFELSKLNAKTEAPHFESLSLPELIAEAVTLFADRAERQDIGIFMDVPKGFPGVYGDHKMLTRVFANLFDNALRYSEQGGEIRIGVRRIEEKKAEVSIADTGIGIAEEELPEVFDRFFRGSRAEKKESSGSGLGLAIVKRIIEIHQQEISVSSCLGKGTTFVFTLELCESRNI